MNNRTLLSMPVGTSGTVGTVGLSGIMRRRLLDLGIFRRVVLIELEGGVRRYRVMDLEGKPC